MKTVCAVVLASLFMTACQTTHSIHDRDKLSGSSNLNSPYAHYRNLASALRNFVGVETSNAGGQERVLIMRNQTMSLQEPLYVVNGFPMGTNYQTVNQVIDMQRVTHIRILRSPAEAIDYGPQSAGGAILIYFR